MVGKGKPVVAAAAALLLLALLPVPLGCRRGGEGYEARAQYRTYEGRITAGSVLGSGKALTVNYGRGQSSPVDANGGFRINGRTESAALLTATDEEGNVVLQSIYPKTDHLPQRPARLDYLSTAVAMVFNRPGFATANPVAAAVLTRYIETIPETQELAALLEDKAKENPSIIRNPDEEVFALLSKICQKVVEDAEKAGAGNLAATGAAVRVKGAGFAAPRPRDVKASCGIPGIWGETPGDTANAYFSDADGVDGDGVDMITSWQGQGNADFKGINRYMRWVAVYCDPLGPDGKAELPQDSEAFMTPVAMLEPRNFSLLPTLSDLLRALLVDGYKDVLKEILSEGTLPEDLPTPEDYGKELWDVVLETMIENWMPTEGEFRIEAASGRDYLVTTHGPGIKGTQEGGLRDHLPTLYTGITELCLPLIGVFIDVPDVSPVLRETPSLMRLAGKMERSLRELVDLSSQDEEEAAYRWSLFMVELMQDPDFQNLVCAAYEVTADTMAKLVSLIVGEVVPAVGTYHKVAGAVNLCAGALGLVISVASSQMVDEYYLSPSGNTAALKARPSPSAPQAPRQAISGPVEALKGFFAALEAGDTVAACSYVYTTSYGLSFVTWGVISIYNLVGRTRFHEMQYRETSNDGSRATVYARGKMDYGDQLGLVTTHYLIDGEAVLMVQDGAWKVFTLPPYTLVGTEVPEGPLPQLPGELQLPDYPEVPMPPPFPGDL